jgi:hypothetical protein
VHFISSGCGGSPGGYTNCTKSSGSSTSAAGHLSDHLDGIDSCDVEEFGMALVTPSFPHRVVVKGSSRLTLLARLFAAAASVSASSF